MAKSFDGDGNVVLRVLPLPLPAEGLGDGDADAELVKDLFMLGGKIMSPAPDGRPPSVEVVAAGT